ncbi:Anoctamin-1 [Bagarius yarrelli]|uniref:Anoctamin-1 n=1 Tax=Bagarius yarrelli TaxID=175774 RepID=A0A556VC34_BAGYA|nr:Anoctamin-1 [Bagarius yarrelli]
MYQESLTCLCVCVAAVFLEHWKRKQRCLQHNWDLIGVEVEEYELRPSYEDFLLQKQQKLSQNTKKDEVVVTLAAVSGVILYRIIVFAMMSMNPDHETKANVRVTVTTTAVIINLLVVLFLDEIYGTVAAWITELEIPKTDAAFEEHLIMKTFLLKSMNAFAPVFYVAFFKGRFAGRPGDYVYVFKAFRMEESWDNALARGARSWARHCKASHNPVLKQEGRVHPELRHVGENIWLGAPYTAFTVESAITAGTKRVPITQTGTTAVPKCVDIIHRGNVFGFTPYIVGLACSKCGVEKCRDKLCRMVGQTSSARGRHRSEEHARFQRTSRDDSLKDIQDSMRISEDELADVESAAKNKPAFSISDSVHWRVTHGDKQVGNNLKCNKCMSDETHRAAVKLNLIWNKVPDITLGSTKFPATHTQQPAVHTHIEQPFTHCDDPVVLTHSGPVRGLTLNKAHVFYGIPYAAPPVGPKRWLAPQPVSRWTKPYNATFPRAACVQACVEEFFNDCPHKVGEDCLYLNVFVPMSVNLSVKTKDPLPVMVWIHGGDFIAGSASKPLYDGRFISNYSNTVVVNVEYRLGAFGFLVTGKNPERSAVGNYGVLDQQAALRWVKHNIAAFGGDPEKVTLFGEVLVLSSKFINPFRFLEVFETWGPHLDGELITEQPLAAFQSGHFQSSKPLLIGTTSEEGVIFVYGAFNCSLSVLECFLYTTAIFKQHTFKVLQKYLPVYRNKDTRSMLSQIVTDFIFLCPARRVARSAVKMGGATWLYVFDHTPSDHKIWAGLPFCYDHACHGAELPFQFDSAAAANFSFTPKERCLAEQMVCYWGTFAHFGDPNSHTTPFCRKQRLTAWPKHTPAERWPVLNFTLHPRLQHGNRDQFCDFWDQLDVY